MKYFTSSCDRAQFITRHKQLDVLSPVDNSLICFPFVLICTGALLQTDLWSSLVRPSAVTNDRLVSKKPWCRAVGNTTSFVWSRQVKRVVADALSHVGESWLQPLVVEIFWSVLHWFLLLEKCVSYNCYAGNAWAQPKRRYLCQAYFLLGIQINKIILDQAVCRSELESKSAWPGDPLWFFPFFQSPEIKCYLLRATGRR